MAQAQAMAPSMAPPMPSAMAPAAEPPLAAIPVMAAAMAPSAEPPRHSLKMPDELASFAMKCAVSDAELGDLWNSTSPFKFNEATGRVEAVPWQRPRPSHLGAERASS